MPDGIGDGNYGLSIAAGLAGGIEHGLEIWQRNRDRADEMAYRREKMAADAELHRMQMEKLRQEIAPIEFSLQKFQTIDNAFGAGIVPEKMRNEAVKNVLDQADSPAKLQFINSAIEGKKAEAAQKISMENFGAQSARPAFDPSQAPQMNSQAPSNAEAPASQPQAGPQGFDPTQPITMTPKEAQLYQGLIKSKYVNQAQMAGVQQRDDASQRDYNAKIADLYTKRINAKSEKEAKMYEAEMKRESARYAADQNLRGRVQSASIQADSAVRVANIRGDSAENVQEIKNDGTMEVALQKDSTSKDTQQLRNNGALEVQKERNKGALAAQALRNKGAKGRGAGARTATSPEQKAQLDIIKQKEKALSDAQKPATGFSMELPAEKAKRIASLQGELEQAYSNYDKRWNTNLRGGPAAAPAASGAAPAIIPQGKSAPKVLSGDPATLKAQAKAMPEGEQYTVNGVTWMNQGGKPVQVK